MINRKCISFAEFCMTELLSTTPEGSDMSEIKGEDLTRIHKILARYKGTVDGIFTLDKKYYVDMGLKCYAVGRYVGFDGEYYRFRIEKNHWVGTGTVEDIYEKKQKFMKHVQAKCK